MFYMCIQQSRNVGGGCYKTAQTSKERGIMIYIAILCCIAFGIFEAIIFHNRCYEEDYLLAAISFVAAGFLVVIKLSGAW